MDSGVIKATSSGEIKQSNSDVIRKEISPFPAVVAVSQASKLPPAQQKLPSTKSSIKDDMYSSLSKYVPGILCHEPEMLDYSRRLARFFDVDFDDSKIKAKIEELEKDEKELARKIATVSAAFSKEGSSVSEHELNRLKRNLETVRNNIRDRELERKEEYINQLRTDIGKLTNISVSDFGTVGVEGAELIVKHREEVQDKCLNCEGTTFVYDDKVADMICSNCGHVLAGNMLYDGDWTRAFEGEESTSQIGSAPNRLLSTRSNLRTGFVQSASSNISKTKMLQLQLVSESVEQGSSAIAGVNARNTRVSYMDNQKERVWKMLTDVSEQLNIARPVLERAKELFARRRDTQKTMIHRNRVAASALLAALEESIFATRVGARAHHLEMAADRARVAQLRQEAQQQGISLEEFLGVTKGSLPLEMLLEDSEVSQFVSEHRAELQRMLQQARDASEKVSPVVGGSKTASDADTLETDVLVEWGDDEMDLARKILLERMRVARASEVVTLTPAEIAEREERARQLEIARAERERALDKAVGLTGRANFMSLDSSSDDGEDEDDEEGGGADEGERRGKRGRESDSEEESRPRKERFNYINVFSDNNPEIDDDYLNELQSLARATTV